MQFCPNGDLWSSEETSELFQQQATTSSFPCLPNRSHQTLWHHKLGYLTWTKNMLETKPKIWKSFSWEAQPATIKRKSGQCKIKHNYQLEMPCLKCYTISAIYSPCLLKNSEQRWLIISWWDLILVVLLGAVGLSRRETAKSVHKKTFCSCDHQGYNSQKKRCIGFQNR